MADTPDRRMSPSEAPDTEVTVLTGKYRFSPGSKTAWDDSDLHPSTPPRGYGSGHSE